VVLFAAFVPAASPAVELPETVRQGLSIRGQGVPIVGLLDEAEVVKLAKTLVEDARGDPVAFLSQRPELLGVPL
jgi:hypothetical protein